MYHLIGVATLTNTEVFRRDENPNYSNVIYTEQVIIIRE